MENNSMKQAIEKTVEAIKSVRDFPDFILVSHQLVAKVMSTMAVLGVKSGKYSTEEEAVKDYLHDLRALTLVYVEELKLLKEKEETKNESSNDKCAIWVYNPYGSRVDH